MAADLEIVLPGPNAGPAPRKAPVAPGKKTIKPLPKNPPDRVNLPPGFNTGLRQVGVARRGSVPVLPSVGEAPLTGAPSVAPPGGQIPVNGRLGRTLSTTVNIFRMPDPQSQWVGTLSKGQQVAIVSQWQGWWAIVMGDGSQAYVPQSHVEVLPYQVRSITAASPAPAPQPAAPGAGAVPGGLRTAAYSGPAKALLDEAYRYMGTPYVYGGNSESGIDCSGLVRNCFSSLGVQLPRRASEQARVGAEVPLSELQAGDRLYFSVGKDNDHTGIYIGDGYFIHAARSRGKVTVDHLSTAFYGTHLTGARR